MNSSRVLEVLALTLLPLVMTASWLVVPDQSAGLSLLASAVALTLFFVGYEWGRPGLREIMPIIVLAALAAAGRILFAALPDIKPVSAIAIIAGAVYGRRGGFMVGALAALVSNFFFGQGAWTPWQMYAWGMVGWFAGLLASTGVFKRSAVVYAYGFVSGLIYGLIVNLWSIIGFFHPQKLGEALAVIAPAIPLDIVHGVATVGFLIVLWNPWLRKLSRLKT